MNCLFPSLESCDPSTITCLGDQFSSGKERKSSNGYFWRPDGILDKVRSIDQTRSKSREKTRGRSRSKSRERIRGRSRSKSRETLLRKSADENDAREDGSCLTKGTKDDETTFSYFPSRYDRSDTEMTYPTTASESNDSEETEWTKLTATTQNTRTASTPWMQQQAYQQQQDVPTINNVWSSDSVGAVKTSAKDHHSEEQGAGAYNSAFDYILKARNHFSNPVNDPPSDKSMATSRSIRAADAGSVLLRKGVIRQKNDELVRQILKRRELDLYQAGTEP